MGIIFSMTIAGMEVRLSLIVNPSCYQDGSWSGQLIWFQVRSYTNHYYNATSVEISTLAETITRC